MPLNREEIRRRILQEDLVKDYIDLEEQLQLTSFDLTIGRIRWFSSRGTIGFKEKTICDHYEMIDPGGALILEPGAYNIEFNETIKLPLDLCAFSKQRSTVMRNGAMTSCGSWDPGYTGKGQALLIVHNPHGLQLFKNARVHQITFFKIDELREGYKGDFQGEGLFMETNPAIIEEALDEIAEKKGEAATS